MTVAPTAPDDVPLLIKTVPVRAGLTRWGGVLRSVLQRLDDLPYAIRLAETPGVGHDEISDLTDAAAVADAHALQVRGLAAEAATRLERDEPTWSSP